MPLEAKTPDSRSTVNTCFMSVFFLLLIRKQRYGHTFNLQVILKINFNLQVKFFFLTFAGLVEQ